MVIIRFANLKSGNNLEDVKSRISFATYGDASISFNVLAGQYVSIFIDIDASSQVISRTFFQLIGADQYVELLYTPALPSGTSFRTTFKILGNTKPVAISAKIAAEGNAPNYFSNSVTVILNVVNPNVVSNRPTTVTLTTVKSSTTTLANVSYTSTTTQTTTTLSSTTASTVTTQTTITSSTTTSLGWKPVGTKAFSRNGVDHLSFTINPVINEPYVAFQDLGANGLNVMRCNGNSWVNFGSPNFAGNQAWFASLAFNTVTNEPYVAFQDWGNSGKLTVMHYNGSSWIVVGST